MNTARHTHPQRRGLVLAVLSLCLAALALVPATSLAAGPPVITKSTFSAVTSTSATLEATLNPNGAKTTPYHFEYVEQTTFNTSGFATAKITPEGPALNGTSDVPISATITGLDPATPYRFRLFAHNLKGDTPGPELSFSTYAPPPLFGPCPNDAFRSGELAPPGHPSATLPDCRAYEQASPINKDGGDAVATVPLTKASPSGNGITFASSSGLPGGEGAQEFPLYFAGRDPGGSGWTSRGLQPPAAYGPFARVIGWAPEFSSVYSYAGTQGTSALLAQPGGGGPLTQLTPSLPTLGGSYAFVGSAKEGSEVVFESKASLATSPPGVEDTNNVYVWDRATGEVSLVSVHNDQQPLNKGAFGGSYDWTGGTKSLNLAQGGSFSSYYTQDTHAVSSDGSVYFTAAGTGQLYLRLNPTQPQSALDGDGHCAEPAKACTIHVSATHRTPPDTAGNAPAAFMAASAEGSTAFFTSSEKLTDDANTGPDQPEAKIGRSRIDGQTELEPDWLPGRRATGIAVDSNYVYWADPVGGTIGRAEIDGGNPEPNFIEPGPTFFEEEIETSPGSGEFETITGEPLSKPRYVAVDAGHVYWTNTADGKDGHGSIGRADIEGTILSIEPECITGVSNPQGIAVNAENIYWANAGASRIARAEIDCEEAQQDFQRAALGEDGLPQGLALNGGHLYWLTITDSGGRDSYLFRAPLEGTPNPEFRYLGAGIEPRGIAIDAGHVYWSASSQGAISRLLIADWGLGNCDVNPSCEKEFIELEGGPSGLAVDAEHLYWSTNGESQPNPGNDLYRFRRQGTAGCSDPGGCLDDLTPGAVNPNGAEVQGVLGVSQDGSRLYFTANAVLDEQEEAAPGTCQGSVREAKGQCSLYQWQEGTISFIARLNATGSSSGGTDADNWALTTRLRSGSEFQKTSFLSADGHTLLFRSQQQLTSYDNEGFSQLYRYHDGEPITCLSCNPTGEAPKGSPTLGSIKPSTLRGEAPASLASRNLSAEGNRAFFETPEALVAADTDGLGGCPRVGSGIQIYSSCLDVYEWEAPGTGTCTAGGPAYSPLNRGCLYLLSPGDDDYPSLLADASASGDDVFFFTRSRLVGQDQDQLLDVYDARVSGGLASQNPLPDPAPCEAEGCMPAPNPAPPAPDPVTPAFQGPADPPPRHKKPGRHKKHKKKKKRHANQRHSSHRTQPEARR